jgi:sucrose-6-phosphate hydrolase SacC (GH32 family)
MHWRKCGLIEGIISKIGWTKTHAQVPTLLIKKNALRVYFATRPSQDMTLITFCDLDIKDPQKVLYVHDKAILELGQAGTFDQFGIMPSSVVNHNGVIYLYYSGWSRSVGVPYNNYTGLAISEDGGTTFRKAFKGPILDRTPLEIYSATSPEVYYDNSWHMWYCSGTNWHNINGKFEHTYNIKYAHSNDGIRWKQNNQVAIVQKNEYEAITKPTVLYLNGKYHMWYCYRGSFDFRISGLNSYKIGYATSTDLIHWERIDGDAGIKSSDNGWDCEMLAYPAVINTPDNIYLFYNGNNFGKEGFGYAQLINT